MSAVSQLRIDNQAHHKSRTAAIDNHPSIFTDIYQEDVNIAIWKRELSNDVKADVKDLLKNRGNYREALIATPQNTHAQLVELGDEFRSAHALCEDIAELVDMFCLLNDQKQAGLRLAVLDDVMCPRFHTDKVPCRLICTYHGVTTEWLPHNKADRSKLGRGNDGLADDKSGIYQSEDDINQLEIGDVAMLKGEIWPGNENAGLIHRSPKVPDGHKRLLLTLDFCD